MGVKPQNPLPQVKLYIVLGGQFEHPIYNKMLFQKNDLFSHMGPSPHTFFEECLTRSISTPFSAKIEKKKALPNNVQKLLYCPLPGPIWALSTPKIVVQGLSQTCLLQSYMHARTGMAVCHQYDAQLRSLRQDTLNNTHQQLILKFGQFTTRV
jgi:hypothetical protein